MEKHLGSNYRTRCETSHAPRRYMVPPARVLTADDRSFADRDWAELTRRFTRRRHQITVQITQIVVTDLHHLYRY